MSGVARVDCDVCERELATAADNDHGCAPECDECSGLCWRHYGGDCDPPDWIARARAAEQRAEAAEAERDRMRPVVAAAEASRDQWRGTAMEVGDPVAASLARTVDVYRTNPAPVSAGFTFVRMPDGSGYNILDDDGVGIAVTKSKVQAARIVAALGRGGPP